MGNDGGSIPKRRELVKEAARDPSTAELKESRHEQQEYHWTTDPISQKPLARPIVSDNSGKLYNKDTILEYLVEGSRKQDADTVTRGAVKTLKDVVEVKLEVDDDVQVDGTTKHEIWKCPVTGDRLGPGSKAVYLVPCGHAFSGSAIKEVSGERCVTCDTEYASNDIIPILPTSDTDVARLVLRTKTLQEKGLTHSLKKGSGGGKKRKKREELDEKGAKINGTEVAEVKSELPQMSITPVNGADLRTESAAINNTSTASLTSKVMQEQERVKKRKTESENVRSLFSSRNQSQALGKSGDFMTRGFSIANGAKR